MLLLTEIVGDQQVDEFLEVGADQVDGLPYQRRSLWSGRTLLNQVEDHLLPAVLREPQSVDVLLERKAEADDLQHRAVLRRSQPGVPPGRRAGTTSCRSPTTQPPGRRARDGRSIILSSISSSTASRVRTA
ncbi:hypothetical protein ACRAWF_30270 [Streptomyces sp. L7]